LEQGHTIGGSDGFVDANIVKSEIELCYNKWDYASP
jgi:hypothetical protein